jgi:RecA/RadA recombinase
MSLKATGYRLAKLPAGTPGFDLITLGGLPKGRTTLVAGAAGSAKTVMAAQFLAERIKNTSENGVFVTFEESLEDIRNNMMGLGWDIRQWESEGRWIRTSRCCWRAATVSTSGPTRFWPGAAMAFFGNPLIVLSQKIRCVLKPTIG